MSGPAFALALAACPAPAVLAPPPVVSAAPAEARFTGPLRPIPEPFHLQTGPGVRLACVEREIATEAAGQTQRTRRWIREQRQATPSLVLKFLEDSSVTTAVGTPDRPLYEASAGLITFRLVNVNTQINIPLSDATHAEVTRFLRARIDQSITYPQRVAQDETHKRGDTIRVTPRGLTTVGGRDAVVITEEDRRTQPGGVRMEVRGFTVTDLASGADLQRHRTLRLFGPSRDGRETEVTRLDSSLDCAAETL
jgi:hypothetical protein